MTTSQAPCRSAKWRRLDPMMKDLQIHEVVSPNRMYRQYLTEDIRSEQERIFYRLGEPKSIAVTFWFSLATTNFIKQKDEDGSS